MSETFRNITQYDQFKDKLFDLSEELAERMDKRKLAGLNISVEIKTADFNVLSKSFTLKTFFSS